LRLDVVTSVFRKELREMLRDRRSLLIMFGVPLVLYPLLTAGLAGLAGAQQKKAKEKVATVAVINGEAAPHLVEWIRAKGEAFRMADPPYLDAAGAKAALEAGQLDAVLEVPPDAEAALLAGGEPEFVVTLNRSRLRESSAAGRKMDDLLEQYQKWVIEQRLRQRNIPATVLAPVKSKTVDIATAQERLGSLMAGILPLFLLLTGMLGSFFPALNATTTERERGTLETLLASPAGRTELLVGKGLLVLLGGMITSGLNMASMALVLWRVYSLADKGQPGGLLSDLAVNPAALALTYLAAVPTFIFFAGLVMIVGLLARTYQEANAFATPVLLLPISAAAIGVADPETTTGLLMTPIANTTVIIRDVLTGRATVGAFLLAFGSSCLYAGLLLSAAARLFNTEQLVNPAWEPLSIKGLGRRRKGTRRVAPWPGVDEAVALFAVTLLLTLYVTPSLRHINLLGILFVTEVMLIAAPALALAWLRGYDWVQTFSLRPGGWGALAGGALVGVGLIPLVQWLYVVQNKVWPAPAGHFKQILDLFLPALQKNPVLTIVGVGVLAGVCEELLYRGPIQAALLRKLPAWLALLVGAFLFAFAHLDTHGLPLRLLLGLVLGYVVWHTGSIYPAIVLHGIYDATQIGLLWWTIRTQGVAKTVEQVSNPAATRFDTTFLVQFAVGCVLLLVGGWLLLRKKHSQDELASPADHAFPVLTRSLLSSPSPGSPGEGRGEGSA
jgi:sodium transport system permease protein